MSTLPRRRGGELPEVTFNAIGLPTLAEIKGDFFYEDAPNLPSVDIMDPKIKGSIQDRAKEWLKKTQNGVKGSDFKYVPLPEDAYGCPVGLNAADRASALNFRQEANYRSCQINSL